MCFSCYNKTEYTHRGMFSMLFGWNSRGKRFFFLYKNRAGMKIIDRRAYYGTDNICVYIVYVRTGKNRLESSSLRKIRGTVI